VRLIGADGAPLGVVAIGQALQLAAAAGLDLIEINRSASPPVCKIMDRSKLEEALAKKAGRGKPPTAPA
jgi:translation initiation factor IF-3